MGKPDAVTRILTAIFPLTWALVSYGLFVSRQTQFPNLPPDYVASIVIGLMLAFALSMMVRIFIWIVFDGQTGRGP